MLRWPVKRLSSILVLLLLAVIVLLVLQNRQPLVELVLLNQLRLQMSLSVALLSLYGVGIALGVLLTISWAFQDALARRRFMRQLNGPAASSTPFEPQPQAASTVVSEASAVPDDYSPSDRTIRRADRSASYSSTDVDTGEYGDGEYVDGEYVDDDDGRGWG